MNLPLFPITEQNRPFGRRRFALLTSQANCVFPSQSTWEFCTKTSLLIEIIWSCNHKRRLILVIYKADFWYPDMFRLSVSEDWGVSPKSNPAVQSCGLNWSGNPHRCQEHHVRPVEVFLFYQWKTLCRYFNMHHDSRCWNGEMVIICLWRPCSLPQCPWSQREAEVKLGEVRSP